MCWFGKTVTYLNTSTHSNSLKPTANLSKVSVFVFHFRNFCSDWVINKCETMLILKTWVVMIWAAIFCAPTSLPARSVFFFFISSWNDTVNCVLKLNCTLTSEYSQGGVCVCGWAVRLCGPECWTLACPPQPAPSPDSHCQSAQMTRSLHVTNASHHTSTPHRFHLFLFCNLFVFTLIMLIWNKFSSKVEY